MPTTTNSAIPRFIRTAATMNPTDIDPARPVPDAAIRAGMAEAFEHPWRTAVTLAAASAGALADAIAANGDADGTAAKQLAFDVARVNMYAAYVVAYRASTMGELHTAAKVAVAAVDHYAALATDTAK